MRGMLGLSMTPLATAVRLSGASNSIAEVRSVIEFNSTQYGELSELLVLSSSFELEWKSQWPQNDSGGYFFANNNGSNGQSDRFVLSSDKKIFGAGFNGTQIIDTAFSDQSIHTFRLVSVLGGDVTFYVDDTIAASAPALFPVNINSIGDQYDSATGVTNYAGIFYDLKVWTNGDRSTGDLILNVPFNESGSDYQRNHAVALGAELQNSIISDDFGGFAPESASGGVSLVAGSLRATKLSSSSPSSIAKIKNLEIGKKYKISVKHATGYEGLKAFVVGTPTDWRYYSNWWVFSNPNGYAEFIFTPDQSEVRILLSSGDEVGGYVDYDNVSIREWAGVVLQTALPDDWMQLERKRWWDYWREVGNESNILEIAS